MREPALRLTWAWVWTLLALIVSIVGAGTIAAIALSGADSGEVALAALLIGFPALLAAFALGSLALMASRPTGAGRVAIRRWLMALVAGVCLLAGLAVVPEDGLRGAVLIAAGGSFLAFLVRDLRRGRRSE